jgi:biopolymer transport protein ExbD
MAFSMHGNGNGRSRFRGGSYGALSEINVVPLVDVVLVLLIIFMLTAHVMEFGLEVDVPKVKQVQDTSENLPVVTLMKNGEVYLADKPVNINLLGDAIRAKYPKSTSAFVRADKGTVWDPIAQVVSKLNEGKIAVKLVTQPEDESARGR